MAAVSTTFIFENISLQQQLKRTREPNDLYKNKKQLKH